MTRQTRRGISLVDVTVTIVILLLLFTLIVPGCMFDRGHPRTFPRSECKNNLKQLGLAIHNYHDVYSAFPPGWVAVRNSDSSGQTSTGGAHGWNTFLLPYLDALDLYAGFDFKQPLGVGANKPPLVSTVLPTFGCPSDKRPEKAAGGVIPGMATTNYVGNFGVGLPTVFGADTTPLQGIFGVNSRIRFRDIKDGTSNVVLAGERCVPEQGRDWPVDAVEGPFNSYSFGIPSKSTVSPLSIVATVTGNLAAGSGPLSTTGNLTALGTNDSPGTLTYFGINRAADETSLGDFEQVTAGFSSRHEGGCHVLLSDGSVRFISAEIDRRILTNLMRRSDGVPIGEF
jgi:hypothetical protein